MREQVVVPFPTQSINNMGYRQYNGDRWTTGRDLPPEMHDRNIALSFAAYRMNPMAHRLIELQCNFVLGSGIYISSDNPDVLGRIMEFWANPYNAWPKKIAQRLRDLYIYGEWFHRPLVAGDTGATYIRDLQPDSISHLVVDPDNHSEIDTAVIKQVIMGSEVASNIEAKVIRRRLLKMDNERVMLTPPIGDIFHFGIGRTTDTTRGVGILFPVLDMLDLYDSILFSRAEKIENMAHMYYDLTLKGLSEDEITTFLANETNMPPRPGSVYAHNESAEVKIVAPDMKADDHAVDTANFKSFIVSTMGWPGTWFDDPGTAGRAVGAEMAEPALKNVVALQVELGIFLKEEINFMLHQCIACGTLDPAKTDDRDPFSDARIPAYSISFSQPSARDFQRSGPALSRLSMSLDTLVNKVQVLAPEEARAIISTVINQLDMSDIPLAIDLPDSLRGKPAPAIRAEEEAQKQADQQAELDQQASDLKQQQADQSAQAMAQAQKDFNAQAANGSNGQQQPPVNGKPAGKPTGKSSAITEQMRVEINEIIMAAHKEFGVPKIRSTGQIVMVEARQ